jgi:CHAT domain-containing protein
LQTAPGEVRSIAALFGNDPTRIKLFTGNEGTSQEIKSTWEGGVDAFHFATHALADLRQPLASLLMLPAENSNGESTYLTAGQVQEWGGDVNLVYLSACETAVGPARFADGMPGLQRAFLRAGARGVIATLWPIEDVYAAQFAADFYRRYAAGWPPARSLSETQRAWMQPVADISAREQAYRRLTAWAHVYYTR